MLSYRKSATPNEIFNAITSTAVNPQTTDKDSYLGYGVINVVEAIKALSTGGGNNGGGIDSPTEPPLTTPPVDDNQDCVDVSITIQTDRYGSDIAHWLQSQNNGEFLFFENSLDSFQTYQEKVCIFPFECYTYNIRDSYCDGILGEGLEIRFGNDVVYSGGSFGCGGFKELGAGC
jgi:hypothetical protein